MTILTIVLGLLIAQGLLGGFDTVYHHELQAALPQQHGAILELRIHAVRAVLYGVLFAGLAWFAWGGWWVAVLATIVLVEVGLTLWDFVVEDGSRLLPHSERVLHTVLAINGGAIFGMLCLVLPQWWSMPTDLHYLPHGWQSWVLSLFAAGVAASGVRDALAAQVLSNHQRSSIVPDLRFAGPHQRVLITGGTGFIGQALCRALLGNGHDITLLTRTPLKAAYQFGGRVRCITGFDQLDSAAQIDVVINLAGAPVLGPRWTQARKEFLLASRIGTTRALLQWIAAAQHKPRLMLSASAIGYYGVQSPDDPARLTEESASQPVFMSELCQRWEQVSNGVQARGVPLALLRLGVVFGHQGALPMMLLPFGLGMGGPLGGGRQMLSWVHIDDVLGVLAHLIAAPDAQAVQGVYNLTAPHAVTQRQFAQIAGKILRRPSLVPTPAWAFRLLLGEQATLLLDGQRVYPARLERSGYRFRFPTVECALQNLRGVR